LDYLALARAPHGAWGRAFRGAEGDLRTTVWCMSALRSARLINEAVEARGRRAPLQLAPATWSEVRHWLDGDAQQAGDYADEHTAARAWLRILLGADPTKDERVQEAARHLAAQASARAKLDPEYAAFGTLVAFQVGGTSWRAWRRSLDALTAGQRGDTDYCARKGSWDPVSDGGRALGRVGTTALHATELTVLYRYSRVSAGRSHPARAAARRAQTPARAPRTEAERAAESAALQRRMAATTASGPAAARVGASRKRGGHEFVLESGGRWVDAAWDRKAAPTQVEAWSEAYFDLVQKSPAVARFLALGERVVFVLGDVVYEVAPSK